MSQELPPRGGNGEGWSVLLLAAVAARLRLDGFPEMGDLFSLEDSEGRDADDRHLSL